ncbi:MAG TPA: GNAT family N-acetyltransferase [Caldimonas sp.]|nr:GNAT family N-acetyltransferase [Caldimonas sp.]
MTAVAEIRPLVAADLRDYKQLRDEMLLAHPEAFTSDAAEEKSKEPADYLYRLGLDRRGAGGHFLLGAWRGERLIGAIGCERELRAKVRHIGHVVGLMVRRDLRGRGVGRELLDACIGEARRTEGIELLVLTVTSGNEAAVRLYQGCGFIAYGTLPRAVRIGHIYHDKLHMALRLR